MAEPLYAFRLDDARRIKASIGSEESGGIGGKATLLPKDGSGGSRFYVLMEDFSGNGPAYAKHVSRTNNTSRGVFQVACFDGIMDGAKAGYKGTCILIDDEWVPPVNPCIVPCESAGSLAAGSPADGEVGTPYTHTVTPTAVDAGSIVASDLPDGLTIDDTTGDISGTPTTAGTFYAVISGQADKTGPGTPTPGSKCTVTVVVPIVIAEAP